MKRKSYSGKSIPIVKTSITLPEVLVRFAEAKMVNEGFPTLSSYLVHLLHTAKERDQEEKLLLAKVSADYPLGRQEASHVEERSAPPKKKTGT